MKNSTKPQKLRKAPSELTRWAYMMQAIEPKSEKINKIFPGYHPQWVQMSQRMTIAPENFMMLRLVMGMTVEQCAAYLRTTPKKITEWESGRASVPFAEFELLRVVLETVGFRTAHPEWDGWFVSSDGKLVSPREGNACFTPSNIELLPRALAENARMKGEISRLQEALQSAQEENTKLRQMFLSQGVVDELYSLKDRMNELVKQMATAKIIPLRTSDAEQKEERVA